MKVSLTEVTEELKNAVARGLNRDSSALSLRTRQLAESASEWLPGTSRSTAGPNGGTDSLSQRTP